MEQPARNVIGSTLRRLRTSKGLSQQKLSVECARLGYEFPRGTLAKVEAGIRATSDVEIFVLAHALGADLRELFPAGLLRRIRDGKVEPFHTRGESEAE